MLQHPQHQDGKRVLECLQRGLRITDGMSGSSGNQVPLFIDILEAVRLHRSNSCWWYICVLTDELSSI